MTEFEAKLVPNGDGTGNFEVICRNVRLHAEQDGKYSLAALDELLPFKLKCGDSVRRPRMILRLFCQSPKPKRESRLEAAARRLRVKKAQIFNPI